MIDDIDDDIDADDIGNNNIDDDNIAAGLPLHYDEYSVRDRVTYEILDYWQRINYFIYQITITMYGCYECYECNNRVIHGPRLILFMDFLQR